MRTVMIFLTLATAGCSSSEKGDSASSAGDGEGEGGEGGDDGGDDGGDGGNDGGDSDDPCTATGFEAEAVETTLNADGWFLQGTNLSLQAGIRIESWSEYGGPTELGVYEVEAVNYADCGLCLLMAADCIDEDNCNTYYYADTGSLEITTAELSENGAIEATLTDVVFREVTIDNNYNSTLVEDGKTWCVDGTYAGIFPETLNEGDAAPDYSGPDQNGDTVSISSLQGTMLVALFNANDWCPYCVNEAGTTEALWQEMKSVDERYDVSFVEFLYDDGSFDNAATQEDATTWADRFGNTYPVLHGEGARTYFDESDLTGFPSYWVVDPLGQIRSIHVGQASLSTEMLQEQFEAFLADNPDWTRD